jgi:hypothetical protein
MNDKHLIMHNMMGLKQIGFSDEEALEMALDSEEDLFPENWKRLKLTRPGVSGAARDGRGSAIGPGGEGGFASGG